MSVFTPVSEAEARAWLKNYTLGQLVRLEGIAAGIENTNYFLATTHGQYVLTLFEKLALDALPYYVHLMAHLAHHGIPCPLPIEKIDGEYLGQLNGRPACIVTRLAGRPLDKPSANHCVEVGEMLAEMHLAGLSYGRRIDNWRGLSWWKTFVAELLPLLPEDEARLASAELEFQLAFQGAHDYGSLPRGVIHGDLFRDNVLFEAGRIGGVIDFYFACNETLLFDLAVTANDWCVTDIDNCAGGIDNRASGADDCASGDYDRASGDHGHAGGSPELDGERAGALIDAYHAVRPLSSAERRAWPAMLRAAAFRSWLGRLGYTYFPQAGEMTHTKDHGHFRRLLEHHAGAS